MHKKSFKKFPGFTQASASPRKCVMKMKVELERNDACIKLFLMEEFMRCMWNGHVMDINMQASGR